ncbi:MAG: hypothetical protein JWP97_4631 [Labilithrix sp.]|nr:hypothetical protein [Labilithrix sp.]
MVLPLRNDSAGLEWIMPTRSRLFVGSRMPPEHRATLVSIANEQNIPVFDLLPAAQSVGLD